MSNLKTIKLERSNVTVTYPSDYSVSDLLFAQKASVKDNNQIPLNLMERICKFDGQKMKRTEIMEKLTGADYLKLAGLIMSPDDEEGEDEVDTSSKESVSPPLKSSLGL